MYYISDFTNNDDVEILDQLGPLTVIKYQRDLSAVPSDVTTAYFGAAVNVRKRQVVCDPGKVDIALQVDTMQQMAGNVNATAGIKGVGDLFGKAVRGKVTGESAIKPGYIGDGTVVLESTYHHIILLDLTDWNDSVVLDDGLFLARDSNLKHKTVMRSNPSSTVAGGEGLFNLGIDGSGVLYLGSPRPREELVEITLDNDVFKTDGNMAIARNGSPNFTVEYSDKSLIGSAAPGEGLVNIYRDTGKVLLAPAAE